MKKSFRIDRVLFFLALLVVIPAGSYYYLQTGQKYYLKNMEMLEPKSELADFSFTDQNGKDFTTEQLGGLASVVHFLPGPCNQACADQFQQLQRVQTQFEKANVRLMTVALDSAAYPTARLKTMANEQNAISGFWLLQNGTPQQTKRFYREAMKGFKGDNAQQQFILVDDSLRVRNYYAGTDSSSVDLLIRHLAMVMPKEKRSTIRFEREKEK